MKKLLLTIAAALCMFGVSFAADPGPVNAPVLDYNRPLETGLTGMAVVPPVVKQDNGGNPFTDGWSIDLAFATDSHKYALTRKGVVPEKPVRPDWQNVKWAYGPCAGQDLTAGKPVYGASVWVTANSNNQKAYLRLGLDYLTGDGRIPGLLGTLSAGFKF